MSEITDYLDSVTVQDYTPSPAPEPEGAKADDGWAALEKSGSAGSVEQFQQNLNQSYGEFTQAIVESSAPVEQKAQAVKALNEVAQNKPSKKQAIVSDLAINADSRDNEERAVGDFVLETIDQNWDPKKHWDDVRIKTLEAVGAMNNTPKIAAGIATQGAVPLSQTGFIKTVIEKTFGIDVGMTYVPGNVGDILRQSREIFNTSTPEQQKSYLDTLGKTISEEAGFLYDNPAEAIDGLEYLGDMLTHTDAEAGADVLWTQFWVAMDAAPVIGKVAKTLYKLGKPALAASKMGRFVPSSAIMQADPKKAAAVLEAAIKDSSGTLAKQLGTNDAEIVNTTILPEVIQESDDLTEITGRITEMVGLKGTPEMQELQRIQQNPLLYLDSEKSQALDTYRNLLDQAYGDIEGVDILSKSSVREVEDGMEMVSILSRSNTSEFSSAEDALEAVESTLDLVEDDVVKVYKYAPEDNAYRVVDNLLKEAADQASGPHGAYIVGVHHKQAFSGKDTIPRQAVAGSKLLAGMLSRSTILSKALASSTALLANSVSRIDRKLLSLSSPLDKLDRGSASVVMQVLDEGDRRGVELTHVGAMEAFGGNTKMVEAYQGIRKFWDLVWEHDNSRYRAYLRDKGFKQLGGDYPRFVRPLKETEALPSDTRIFNSATGEFEKVGHDLEGVVELASPVFQGKEASKYLRMRPRDALSTLPDVVINKRLGYIGRNYDAKYKIVRKGAYKMNGQRFQSQAVVAFSNDYVDGRRALNKLNRLEDGEYELVEVDELFRDKGQMALDELASQSRDSVTKLGAARGEEVVNVSGKRSLQSIADTMNYARAKLATTIGTEKWQEYMIDLFMKNYSKELGITKFPFDKALPPQKSDSLKKLRNEAEAFRKQIQMVLGVDSDSLRNWVARAEVRLAETVAGDTPGLIRGSLSKAVDKALVTPEKAAAVRKLAFYKYIALNPLRQLILQPMQLTMYASLDGGLKYFGSGQVVADNAILLMSSMMGKGLIPDSVVDQTIKRLTKVPAGNSKAYYRNMIKDFRESGMVESVQQHQFMALANTDRSRTIAELDSREALETVKGVARQAEDLGRRGLHLSKELGMGAGEVVNSTNAWLMARRRWMIQNYGKVTDEAVAAASTKKARAEIISAANQFKGNMDQLGRGSYQKGTFGIVFQFMSHMINMAQLMTPEVGSLAKYSNKSISNAERSKIALGQTLLFGTAAFGLDEYVGSAISELSDELGLDLTEEDRFYLSQGFLGYGINKLFQMFDEKGESAKIQVSQSIAPLGGLVDVVDPTGFRQSSPLSTVIGITQAIVNREPIDVWEKLGGAGGSALASAFYDGKGHSLLERLAQLNGVPQEFGTSSLDEGLDIALDFIPAYSNWMQARMAKAIGEFVDKSNNPTVRATSGEIMARALLGLRTQKESEVMDLASSLRADVSIHGQSDYKRIKTEAAKGAQILQSRLMRLKEGKISENDFYQMAQIHMELVQRSLDPNEFETYRQEFWKAREKFVGKGDREDQLNQLLYNSFGKMTENSKQELIDRIEATVSLDNRQALLDYMNSGWATE